MAKATRVLQEMYKPLIITPPETSDPKVKEWAKNLEDQINKVLIRQLQENQDRLLAALSNGTAGITTTTVVLSGDLGLWKWSINGNKMQLSYNDRVIVDWDGAE